MQSILMSVDGGETVLHLRVKCNQLECLKLLVQSQSDNAEFLNSIDDVAGNTILHLATMLKQIEVRLKKPCNYVNLYVLF